MANKNLLDHDLKSYVSRIEMGDESLFEDQSEQDEMYNDCTNAIEAGFAPNAHYLLGIYHFLRGDDDKANEERLKAAQLGHCVAAIDYGNQASYDSVEILSAVKAMNDAGESLASAQEIFDDAFSSLSKERKDRIEVLSKEITDKMKANNLEFLW